MIVRKGLRFVFVAVLLVGMATNYTSFALEGYSDVAYDYCREHFNPHTSGYVADTNTACMNGYDNASDYYYCSNNYPAETARIEACTAGRLGANGNSPNTPGNNPGGTDGGGTSPTPSTPSQPKATVQTITFQDEESKNKINACDDAADDWAFLICPTGDILSTVVDFLLGWISGLLRWNYLIDAASPGLGDGVKY